MTTNTTPALISCAAKGCGAQFFHVPARVRPELCIEHGAEASRADGWTPANSAD